MTELSDLIALVERLGRSAKGLVQEATDEHLSLLANASTATIIEAFAAQDSVKSEAQVESVKRYCRVELERRAQLEAMDKEFHAGEGAEDDVTPYHVSASGKGIDYGKLVKRFGSKMLTGDVVERLERLTKQPAHRWIRRGYFFSHRAFDEVLDCFERKEEFYLYTGRGPSSSAMHFGHLIPFMMTKYLQDVFGVPLVVQMTDDEKFLWKKDSKDAIGHVSDAYEMTRQNARDIIAIGFDPAKTFIFSDLHYVGHMWPNICSIARHMSGNQVKAVFGFDDAKNVGQFHFPAVQAAPSFSSSFPHIFGEQSNLTCLIPCAIDQDPYFRLTREVAPKLGFKKPALLHSKFFPALQGAQEKMSASSAVSAIYLTDTPEQIRDKIRQHAFSGGRDTPEKHRELGADLSVDVSIAYLEFFLDDDEELKRIKTEYGSGRMLTGEVKDILIRVLTDVVLRHQRAREAVTEGMIDAFFAVRDMRRK
jgi:tryptophanyl-tRNA synthetase